MARDSFDHQMELGGLAIMGMPSVVEAYHGHHGTHPTGRIAKWLTHSGKPLTEIAGLGMMAVPSLLHLSHPGNRAAVRPVAKQADASLQQTMWDSAFRCLAKMAEGGVEYRGKHFPGYNQPIASDKKDKKMMVLVRKGDEVRLIHFGQKGYKHNYSPEAKENYLARSAGIRDKDGGLTKDDPFSPNYWARRVLWPKGPTTQERG